MNRMYIGKVMAAAVAAITAISLSGCTQSGSFQPTPTVTQTVTVTAAPSPQTRAPSPSGASGPRQTFPTTKTSPSTPPKKDVQVTLYFVGTGDNDAPGEAFGCTGDRLIAAPQQMYPPTDGTLLETAMTALLANHHDEIGSSGLRNALAVSRLHFDYAILSTDIVAVHLNGKVRSGGTCDDHRIIAQLERTATTATGKPKAIIYVNNVDIAKLLSASGK